MKTQTKNIRLSGQEARHIPLSGQEKMGGMRSILLREVEFCDHLIARLDERISNGEPTAISAALRVQAQRLKIFSLTDGAGAAETYDWSRLSDSELETLRDLLKKAIVETPIRNNGAEFGFDEEE